MNNLSRKKEKKLAGLPKGTFALMLLLGALLFAGWAFMFFARFIEHGPVS